MSFHAKKIPSPEEIKEELPLPNSFRLLKEEKIKSIKEILSGKSDRLLFLIGPCSAHDPKAVFEYCKRLEKLQERVEERILLIPRIYTAKPRSRGVGYRGMLLNPIPGEREDAEKGIKLVRKLCLSVIEETGLFPADEMLYPENYAYAGDLFVYHAVGARSCEDALHRAFASGIEEPVGFKNPTSGNLSALADSVFAAQAPQVFNLLGCEIRTDGNPFAHAILRGGVDRFGKDFPNYSKEELFRAEEALKGLHLSNPAVILDANHSNSGKDYTLEPRIVEEVLKVRKEFPNLKTLIKGFMLESFLKEGSGEFEYGKSITDPCLGWEESERLILFAFDNA